MRAGRKKLLATRTSASLFDRGCRDVNLSASRRNSQLLAALRASLLTRTSASLIHLVRCNFFASASRRDSQLLAALRASLLTRTAHAKTIRRHRRRSDDRDRSRQWHLPVFRRQSNRDAG